MSKLQVVIVTPEMTTLDKSVDSVIVPLFDGQKGILPGHAPMIGRLGPGELRIKDGSAEESYSVDGGFVQVEGGVVSILTGKSEAAGT
jgi:F-type H+-transporting ATPase subunit epsilon